jgi:hypothetical protein
MPEKRVVINETKNDNLIKADSVVLTNNLEVEDEEEVEISIKANNKNFETFSPPNEIINNSTIKNRKNISAIPQTLITCLEELQSNGNLVSWRVNGQGENLSVKVTWNNDNPTSRNIFNSEKIKNLSPNNNIGLLKLRIV